MLIDVDADTFHQWAADAGYVRLSDLPGMLREIVDKLETSTPVQRVPDGPAVTAVERAAAQVERAQANLRAAELAKLEQIEDLKPIELSISDAELRTHLRALVSHFTKEPDDRGGEKAGQALLARYGVSAVSEVPQDKRAEFVRWVEGCLSGYASATVETFITAVKP